MLVNLLIENFIDQYDGLVYRDPNIKLDSFNKISTDSRTINDGDLFIALDGENFSGDKFVEEALENGAEYFITHNQIGCSKEIVVDSTLKFIQEFAAYIIKNFKKLKVFGITGTNGKTSTKEILNCILSKRYKVLSNIGNLNNQIGVPLTIFRLEESHEILILEMGTNSEGEIFNLAQIARPSYATITNIGNGHTEKLINKESILEEKSNIYHFFDSDSVFCFNFDDDLIRPRFNHLNSKKISFGITNDAEVMARKISSDFSSFSMCYDKKQVQITLKAPGINNIYNSLCSASLAIKAGVDLETVAAGIESFEGIKNRFKIIELKNKNVIINDTYNANPDSMQKAIEMTSKIFQSKKKIAILGDMLELGKISEEEHIKIGNHLAINGFSELYSFGDKAENYAKKINKGVVYGKLKNHSEIKKYINLDSTTNTVILVKGSRGMRMEKIFDSLNN